MATSERRSTGQGKDRRTSARTQAPAPARPAISPDELQTKQAPAQTRPQRPPEEDRRREEIAKAAYYNAERRGFDGDRELDDWLEAEKAIDGRPSGTIQHEASAPSADGEVIEPPDVQKWAKKLNVPAPRLREAIERVGRVASDVRRYLDAAGGPD